MSDLSNSSNLAGVSQRQQSRPLPTLVIQKERFCCRPKMVKITLLVLLAVLVVLVAISAFADSQNDTSQPRSRARSKLSSARKKKPVVVKVTTTEVPEIEEIFSSTEMPIVLPTSSRETEVEDLIETTTLQPKKIKKVSPRAENNLSPRISNGPIPEGCGECDQEECTTVSESGCPTGLVMITAPA